VEGTEGEVEFQMFIEDIMIFSFGQDRDIWVFPSTLS
jgi:hypothetical protein